MVETTVCLLSSQWFSQYERLSYWVARRWVVRFLGYAGRYPSRDLVDELAQDSVARGYDKFVKRCAQNVCGESERKAWVAQCTFRGVCDALRAKSAYGSISDACAVRDDVLNRFARVRASGFAHGSDEEKGFSLESVADEPSPAPVSRSELESVIARELPAHLRPSALYAACGLTQEQSATLQGLCSRTVRLRLREVAELLNPMASPYAVVVAALEMVHAEL